MYTLMPVNEEEDYVRFCDSSKCLLAYSSIERFVTSLNNSPSINNEKMPTRPICTCKIPVSSYARLIIYDRNPGPDNPIEEG
jgi:hypothetical protein